MILTGTDARPCVPTTVTRLALTGTDAQIVRPYNRYTSNVLQLFGEFFEGPAVYVDRLAALGTAN